MLLVGECRLASPRGRKPGPARIWQAFCVFMSEATLFVEAEALTLCQVIVGTIVTAFFAMETHGWCSALHVSDGQEALLYIGATVGCFDTRTCTHVTQ